MKFRRIPYSDLHKLTEDDRIVVIGEAVMQLEPGRTVAVVLENEPDKIARYCEKMLLRWPDLIIQKTVKSVMSNTVLVKVGRK